MAAEGNEADEIDKLEHWETPCNCRAFSFGWFDG